MQSIPAPPVVSPPLRSSGTPAKPPPPGSRIFEDALSDFKKGLSQKELEQLQCVDFKDVEETIEKIEHDQNMRKKMQNLARIKPFIEGMRQYGKIIEVFLNTSIIAYIWVSLRTLYLLRCVCYWPENSMIQGPIKFLLTVGTYYSVHWYQVCLSLYNPEIPSPN